MMKLAALALLASAALAQSAREHVVTAVRVWPTDGATRVAIEVSGPFEFKYDRLEDPPRVYFDIREAHPRINGKRVWAREVSDKLVQRIRVAETRPGVTRVVMDVSSQVEVIPSQLTSPDRLVIELRVLPPAPAATPAATPATTPAATPATTPAATPATTPAATPRPAQPAPPAATPAPAAAAAGNTPTVETAKPELARAEIKPDLPKVEAPKPKPTPPRPETAKAADAPKPAADGPPAARKTAGAADTAKAALPGEDEPAKAARHTSTGGNSLTRALGLKLNRIVLDAGHGGHDQGTAGPKGLLEKDLVLDVTLRLGKLIQEGLGAEVIYTRSDDTFIPLETRTAIANEKKADLFLSIHANSSPVPRITGVETYYLNFTDSKEGMDLAARENAASHRSIFELQDLLQKITMHEKVDESREFAGRMQAALYAFSSRYFPTQKNRGVKKAPFVVLIGAQMPSVLAEIGFVTNPREEQLLKRPDYRQKLAEALYKGVARYAESLSHFQLAQTQ